VFRKFRVALIISIVSVILWPIIVGIDTFFFAFAAMLLFFHPFHAFLICGIFLFAFFNRKREQRKKVFRASLIIIILFLLVMMVSFRYMIGDGLFKVSSFEYLLMGTYLFIFAYLACYLGILLRERISK